MKSFLRAVCALFLAAIAVPAFAAPLPYVNSPMDTPQALVNAVVTSINQNTAVGASLSTCTGTTTATCTGLRFNVSITGLTTAASTLSAAMAVTNTSITAASQANCMVNGYAGTGVPIPVNAVATANTLTLNIQNVSTGAALNATVPVACQIFN